LTYLYTSI